MLYNMKLWHRAPNTLHLSLVHFSNHFDATVQCMLIFYLEGRALRVPPGSAKMQQLLVAARAAGSTSKKYHMDPEIVQGARQHLQMLMAKESAVVGWGGAARVPARPTEPRLPNFMALFRRKQAKKSQLQAASAVQAAQAVVDGLSCYTVEQLMMAYDHWGLPWTGVVSEWEWQLLARRLLGYDQDRKEKETCDSVASERTNTTIGAAMWLLPRLGVGAALGLEMWRRRRLEGGSTERLGLCGARRRGVRRSLRVRHSEYEDIWLYDLPEQEEALLEASGGDATYGEVSPELIEWDGVAQLGVTRARSVPEDLLSDFGSGSGRALLYLALRTGLPAIGVELSKTRCRCAETYRMLAEPFLQSQVQFLQCDLLDDGPHRDATVVLFANKQLVLSRWRPTPDDARGAAEGERAEDSYLAGPVTQPDLSIDVPHPDEHSSAMSAKQEKLWSEATYWRSAWWTSHLRQAQGLLPKARAKHVRGTTSKRTR
eukprot:g24477.t1